MTHDGERAFRMAAGGFYSDAIEDDGMTVDAMVALGVRSVSKTRYPTLRDYLETLMSSDPDVIREAWEKIVGQLRLERCRFPHGDPSQDARSRRRLHRDRRGDCVLNRRPDHSVEMDPIASAEVSVDPVSGLGNLR